jgi:hypothetical protein
MCGDVEGTGKGRSWTLFCGRKTMKNVACPGTERAKKQWFLACHDFV